MHGSDAGLAPEGFLDIAGQQLEYRLWQPARPSAGPGLMLLHEGLGSVSMWRDFPQRLSRTTGLPVFTWSRRGYGRSSPVPLPRPLSYMHDEARHWLAPVVQASGFDEVVLIGHSDGASIAAINAGETPGPGLRGLVLMAPHFFVEDISLASIAAARRAYEKGDLRARLERHHGANVDCAFWGWNRAWLDPEFKHWDIRSVLGAIAVPTLLIQGADDEYGTLAQIEFAEAAIPGPVTTLVLPACGHAPHRDQPDTTVAAVADFVARL